MQNFTQFAQFRIKIILVAPTCYIYIFVFCTKTKLIYDIIIFSQKSNVCNMFIKKIVQTQHNVLISKIKSMEKYFPIFLPKPKLKI